MASLEERIRDGSARVAVIGLGYVGFPLAQRAKEAGFQVVGIDKYLNDKRRGEIESAGIQIVTAFEPEGPFDVVLICVPTPLADGQNPDISFVVEAAQDVARGCSAEEVLVVLESTSYPGTIREVLLPIFEGAGKRLGSNFHLAYAPERIDPGSGKVEYAEIPRLVGGINEESGGLAASFYEKLVSSVTRVPTPEIAEMAKLLENIFRAVNIALVNEMSLLCRRMGIDIWAVVEAAATKPFGFMPFQPGPGLGGHCIPVDPFYLAWKAKKFDFYPEFIELAGKINRSMPFHVVDWVAEALNEVGKSTSGSRILIVGVAYKEDVGDTRESPALKTIELLAERGAQVSYTDSFVERIEVAGRDYSSVPLEKSTLEQVDCVVIITAHSDVDLELLGSLDIPVVDTRNALRRAGLQWR